MSVYLDASVIVSTFIADDHSQRVWSWLDRCADVLLVSAWATAEFSSALAIRRRAGALDLSAVGQAEANLDGWLAVRTAPAIIVQDDMAEARDLIRTARVELRASDALHLAAARRLGATLATLDKALARGAQTLGVPLADL